MELEFLGTRGSVPVSGKEYAMFGGATSCVRITSGSTAIFIDAGTGMVSAPLSSEKECTILLTHLHQDHLQGLPFFKPLSRHDRKTTIYAASRDGFSAAEAIDKLFSVPIWPLKLTEYPGAMEFKELPDRLQIGSLIITHMEGSHPGGSTIYKVTDGDRSFIYATDYEHGEKDEALEEFAKGASLFVYDGQYTEEEYLRCKGYGHSVPAAGKAIGTAAGAEKIYITHHNPAHSDELLLDMEKKYGVHFIRCGEKITL